MYNIYQKNVFIILQLQRRRQKIKNDIKSKIGTWQPCFYGLRVYKSIHINYLKPLTYYFIQTVSICTAIYTLTRRFTLRKPSTRRKIFTELGSIVSDEIPGKP